MAPAGGTAFGAVFREIGISAGDQRGRSFRRSSPASDDAEIHRDVIGCMRVPFSTDRVKRHNLAGREGTYPDAKTKSNSRPALSGAISASRSKMPSSNPGKAACATVIMYGYPNEALDTLNDARRKIALWRYDDTDVRSHSSFGNLMRLEARRTLALIHPPIIDLKPADSHDERGTSAGRSTALGGSDDGNSASYVRSAALPEIPGQASPIHLNR